MNWPSMPLPDDLALLALVTAMAFTPGPNTTLSAALAANRAMAAVLVGTAIWMRNA